MTVIAFSLFSHPSSAPFWGEGNLRPRHPPCEYLSEYTSRGKLKIPPADRIPMDLGHKARKNPSDNADLDFQAVGLALHIMQLNVEGLSAAKHSVIQSLAENHYSHMTGRRRRAYLFHSAACHLLHLITVVIKTVLSLLLLLL